MPEPRRSPTGAARVVSDDGEEAHQLGRAATRKVKQLGERRRDRRAVEHPATDAARNLAQQLGIDVAGIEGSGKAGRVTVNDVKQIAQSADGE
jgi:pyruvate/2-oxoglutarate dehydrogenase complex dihydrolipoamide acyltransferase (E2) component